METLPDARQNALGGRQDVPLGAITIELQEIHGVDGSVVHQTFERHHLDDFTSSIVVADSRSHAGNSELRELTRRAKRGPHDLHVREMIQRELRFNHLNVGADWLDGDDSAARALSRDLDGEVTDVRPSR